MELIKESAKEYFSKKEYLKAVDDLYKLGINGFAAFAKRTNKEEKKFSWFKTPEFCQSLLQRPNIISEMLQLKEADEILHDYFNSNKFLPEFEEKVAAFHPKLFVSSVRTNMSFLDRERLVFYSQILLPEEFGAHMAIWNFLNEAESSIWEKVDAYFSKISNSLSLDDILCNTVICLEELRFKDSSNKKIHHISSVYNLFIDAYLLKYGSNLQLKSDSHEAFLKKFMNVLGSHADKALKNLLNQISKWIDFRDSILYPYCFDLNIKLEEQNNITYFNRTPQEYYKWELDGTRYNFNKLNYHFKAADIVEYLIDKKELEIPKGKYAQDENGNYQLAIQDWQLRMFLDDLKLNNLVFKGNKINHQNLFVPLMTYSKNRNIRYEQGILNHFRTSKNWTEAFLKLSVDALRQMIEILPYFFMTKEEYIHHNNISLSQLPENSSEDILNLFTYSHKSRKYFNRFNIGFDVWNKPFVEFGDILFCPMMFFANNDWFYGFAQAGIENMNTSTKVRKETATEMELWLGEIIGKKDWSVKVISDYEASKLDGDVDIIVSDNTNSLLIQLKRTKFRLDLREAYYESILTDRKASQQLNDVEKCLSEDNDLYKITGKTQKWIVSNSYENVLERIDGCLKVNYFDLIFALNNPEIETLDKLFSYIEEDKVIKNWLKLLEENNMPIEARLLFQESGLPIQFAEPQKFSQPIIAKDKSFKEYNSLYDKAIDLATNRKFEKAIRLLTNCIKRNPNDFQAWGDLANYYAEISEFESSFECFEKVLSIIPDDPFTIRNYAIVCRDCGNVNKTWELYNFLKSQYWFLELN
nr:tetratricopeptide repeat protein [uncultured Carboxylicivirga sp.]